MTTSPPSALERSSNAIANVDEAIADIRAGRMVILVDDADRENEGDLCIAAEKVTPEAINYMAIYCVSYGGVRIRPEPYTLDS